MDNNKISTTFLEKNVSLVTKALREGKRFRLFYKQKPVGVLSIDTQSTKSDSKTNSNFSKKLKSLAGALSFSKQLSPKDLKQSYEAENY